MRRWWASIRSARRERRGRARVVVYTAVTRNYDMLRPPAIRVPNWSYLCFTDDLSVPRPGWAVRKLKKSALDPIRQARLPKILAHRFLYAFDISIWIDANIGIAGDLAALCETALKRSDIAFFRHGERRPSVAAEIQACVQQSKAPYELMARQYERYRSQGFPDNAGVIPEAGVIIRRHHRPEVRAAMEAWWLELLANSPRDQIGLPYVIWRHSLPITLLDWDLRHCPWLGYGPHATLGTDGPPS